MKIAIRADGGYTIGMGHIMRTLSLAKELSKHSQVFYICTWNEKFKNGAEKVSSEGFDVLYVKPESVLFDMKDIKCDLLITDSYNLPENYFDRTKEIFKRTMYIDDMCGYYFNVDYIVNQNLNACSMDYRTNKGTRLLLGPQYVMLREEFKNAPRKDIKKEVNNILVTVGGSDPFEITRMILGFIEGLNYTFHVVIGPSFQHMDEFKKINLPNVRFYYDPNMYEIMEKCDMAITACGSTIYELAACGIPSIGIIAADNQAGAASYGDEIGIMKNIGWFSQLNKEHFVNVINYVADDYTFRINSSIRGQHLIDGRGAERISNVIFEI